MSLDSRDFCLTPAAPGRPSRRTVGGTFAARRRPNDSRARQQCSGECALQTPATGKRLKLKLAECRKAMIGGIGAITAAVVPLSPFLPASMTHLIAAAAAVMTGFATYLAKNATPAQGEKPPTQAEPESPMQDALAQSPASPPPARHTGPVLAGLALIVGGAVLAGRHTERHSRCVAPFTLLPPRGFSAGR
jgi:hypothetical protein